MSEKKVVTSRKRSLACLVFLAIIIGLCSFCGLIFFWEDSVDNYKKDQEIESVIQQELTTDDKNDENQKNLESKIVPLFHLEDFNNKPIASLIEKYGDPDTNEINNLPVFSHAEWDNDDYNILLDYKNGENLSYGGLFYLKKISCAENDLDENHLSQALRFVGLNYDGSIWIKSDKRRKEIYTTDFPGWENISLKCYDKNGYVYFNAGSEGYMEWATQK